jgi:hypothetical protein
MRGNYGVELLRILQGPCPRMRHVPSHLISHLFAHNRLTLFSSHNCSTTFGELTRVSHCLDGATFSNSVAVPYPACFRKVTREVAGILPRTKRLWPQARY